MVRVSEHDVPDLQPGACVRRAGVPQISHKRSPTTTVRHHVQLRCFAMRGNDALHDIIHVPFRILRAWHRTPITIALIGVEHHNTIAVLQGHVQIGQRRAPVEVAIDAQATTPDASPDASCTTDDHQELLGLLEAIAHIDGTAFPWINAERDEEGPQVCLVFQEQAHVVHHGVCQLVVVLGRLEFESLSTPKPAQRVTSVFVAEFAELALRVYAHLEHLLRRGLPATP
mmetsp:Transcript_32312/g.74966  ORF Transcript_32312/g.74966 Transcript_32312/m.74966 type:complete len:228 (+) Transcript_32312:613-1296(+)